MLINWKKVVAIDNKKGQVIKSYPKIIVTNVYKIVCTSKNRQIGSKTEPTFTILVKNPCTDLLLQRLWSWIMAMWTYYKGTKQQI
jgi:hypothetical protein